MIESNPSLEYNLNGLLGEDSYHIFSYEADSIYLNLLGSNDSTNVSILIDDEYEFNIVFNNYSIRSEFDKDSTSFTKKGFIKDHPNSVVYGHFTQNYFWIALSVDSFDLQIYPIRSLSEDFKEMENTYIISFQPTSWIEKNYVTECQTYYIELGVIADDALYNKYSGDTSFIRSNIEAQILEIEKLYNNSISEFDIKLKYKLLIFENNRVTKYWNYVKKTLLNANFNSAWKLYFPCIEPDIYVLFTDVNLGGGHATQGLCTNNQSGYPGLAAVSTHSHQFGIPPSELTYFTVEMAHEITHVMGAGEGEDDCPLDCVSHPGCTPASLMCQFQCSSDAKTKFHLTQCTINHFKDNLASNCTACLSSFSSPACAHCSYTGAVVVDEAYPFIPDCEGNNIITITYTFINNCSSKSGRMYISYRSDQVMILDDNNLFEDHDQGGGEHFLKGPLISIAPEAEIIYKVVFKLIDNPTNNNYLNTLLIKSFAMRDSEDQTIFNYSPQGDITYIVPPTLNGNINLSALIDASSGYSLASDNIHNCSVNNNAFRLNGTLIVNSDYCLNNTSIIMDANSKILVDKGFTLNINKDRIFGCDNMWDAIEVEEGATLNIEESTIQDGINAVKLLDGSSFTTSNSKYLNNYISVSSILDEVSDVIININDGNRFESIGNLLLSPYQGELSKAAIWAENVREINVIGEYPWIDYGLNHFENLQNGIVLKNSDAHIKNFQFVYIGDKELITSVIDDDPVGHAIYVNGTATNFTTTIGSTDTRDNYVNACQTGVFVKNSDVDIEFCNLNFVGSGIVMGFNSNREALIENNLINAVYNGIEMRLPMALTAHINKNDIRMDHIEGVDYNGVGILGLSAWKGLNIDGNVIHIFHDETGISLDDCQGGKILNNIVLSDSPDPEKTLGIGLFGCSDFEISDNHILGSEPGSNTIGILNQDSPNNRILCNYADKVSICNQFSGISSMTNFLGNTHRRSNYGLILGSIANGSEAIIGTQNHKQNTWPIPTYGTNGAWNTSQDPLTIARSQFIVDVSQYNFYPPNVNDLISLGWFSDIPTFNYTFDCSNRPVLDGGSNFLIPTSTISFDVNPDIKNYLLRRQLYNSIKAELIDTTVDHQLNSFFTSKSSTDYAKLIDARYKFIEAANAGNNDRSNLIEDALDLSSSATGTDDFIGLEVGINEIIAQYLNTGNISDLNHYTVKIINTAELCPFLFGPAVYVARSFLRAINYEAYFDDVVECGEIEPRSDNHSLETFPLLLIPNPVSSNSYTEIKGDQNIKEIIIFNALGRLVNFYNKYEENFRISFINSGIYFVEIFGTNGKVSILKAVVID